ncbi:MAG: rod shape-determining protein MreD [Rhodocyclales bacterium]|nr:rod shape-determining protein MreD [Rhodocyclales bacterium]MBK9595525.1 rod shape-determining protein MreD [Rhodocyclales bacterium]
MQPTHNSRRILLPVRQWFILFSLAAAFFLNLVPLGDLVGVPDWVALVLAFWGVREPLRVGMGTAFVAGLLMDVASGSVIGQHPLAYLLLSFAAGGLSRRILWFPLGQQALHILPLLLATQVVMVVARLVGGAEFPGWGYFLGSFTGALLWFPLTFVLLLPQYQPLEKDENRPI